jgi:phosphoserine phosphatase
LAEQDGAEPVVLHSVGDGEGDLSALGVVGFAFPT